MHHQIFQPAPHRRGWIRLYLVPLHHTPKDKAHLELSNAMALRETSIVNMIKFNELNNMEPFLFLTCLSQFTLINVYTLIPLSTSMSSSSCQLTAWSVYDISCGRASPIITSAFAESSDQLNP